jgi:hypothetical protein
MATAYARSREKDEAARRALQPLAPGERPTAVTAGAVVAAVACLSNVVALIAGFEPSSGHQKPALLGFGAFVAGLIAVGMWRARYWAVLGLQTILALTIVGAALALLGVGNLGAALLAVAVIALAGTLFWFLVKAMARIQMPERPGTR